MFETLPAVHEILGLDLVRSGTAHVADRYRTRLVRRVIGQFREQLRKDPKASGNRDTMTRAIGMRVVEEARAIAATFPQRVVNGTGVLIHTNLGRAPLGDAIEDIGSSLLGYSNLEWDPGTRARGSRDVHVSNLLTLLTGGESALVVNNGASALLLALTVLARERWVVVSRSELVEIGGGFRVPDIIECSGCRLVEVGTTNRTRLADYESATMAGASVLLKVHQSNFVQRGFVESVALSDLGQLRRKLRIPLVYDNGSGLLSASDLPFLGSEPSMEEGLKDGASVVIASGDKLLGSVQAGVIVGKRRLLGAMRKHPLYRALRTDKVRLALLHYTLCRYLQGLEHTLPLWQISAATCDELEARGAQLRLPPPDSRWKRTAWVRVPGFLGGGSNPEISIESVALELAHKEYSASALKSRFASRRVPIVGYVRKGLLFLDLRTVFDDDFPELQQALDELS